jgi:hypothetical protein
MVNNTSRDLLRERAYHKFLARGGQHGSDLDDWLAAEREMTEEEKSTPRKRPSRKSKRAP